MNQSPHNPIADPSPHGPFATLIRQSSFVLITAGVTLILLVCGFYVTYVHGYIDQATLNRNIGSADWLMGLLLIIIGIMLSGIMRPLYFLIIARLEKKFQ